MKVKLLKKLRKESKKFKLIRWHDGQYLITTNVTAPYSLTANTKETGVFYFGDCESLEIKNTLLKYRAEWILGQVKDERRRLCKSKEYKLFNY